MAYDMRAPPARSTWMKAPSSPADSWMGHSVGHWEGDILVVGRDDLNDQTWFDRAGNFHSDALHVVERYSPLSPDALSYEASSRTRRCFRDPGR